MHANKRARVEEGDGKGDDNGDEGHTRGLWLRALEATHMATLAEMFRTQELCDLRVTGDSGWELKLHRVVLAMWSQPFKALLSNPMKEANQHTVHIKEVEREPFHAVVSFMYTGTLPLSLSNVFPILHVADRFAVLSVCDACRTFISRSLSPHNCLSMLMSCEEVVEGQSALHELVFRYCLANFEDVWEQNPRSLRTLPVPLLARLLQSDVCAVSSEAVILAVVTSLPADAQTALSRCLRIPFLHDTPLTDLTEAQLHVFHLAKHSSEGEGEGEGEGAKDRAGLASPKSVGGLVAQPRKSYSHFQYCFDTVPSSPGSATTQRLTTLVLECVKAPVRLRVEPWAAATGRGDGRAATAAAAGGVQQRAQRSQRAAPDSGGDDAEASDEGDGDADTDRGADGDAEERDEAPNPERASVGADRVGFVVSQLEAFLNDRLVSPHVKARWLASIAAHLSALDGSRCSSSALSRLEDFFTAMFELEFCCDLPLPEQQRNRIVGVPVMNLDSSLAVICINVSGRFNRPSGDAGGPKRGTEPARRGEGAEGAERAGVEEAEGHDGEGGDGDGDGDGERRRGCDGRGPGGAPGGGGGSGDEAPQRETPSVAIDPGTALLFLCPLFRCVQALQKLQHNNKLNEIDACLGAPVLLFQQPPDAHQVPRDVLSDMCLSLCFAVQWFNEIIRCFGTSMCCEEYQAKIVARIRDVEALKGRLAVLQQCLPHFKAPMAY